MSNSVKLWLIAATSTVLAITELANLHWFHSDLFQVIWVIAVLALGIVALRHDWKGERAD